MKHILLILLLLLPGVASAQATVINGKTTTQRDAIPVPPGGNGQHYLFYNSTTGKVEVRVGESWKGLLFSDSAEVTSNVAITGGSISGLTKLAGSAGSNLTISSGAITVNRPIHTVLGEGDVADDLVTINGGSEGQVLMLHGVDAGYNVTLKEQGGGNIKTGGLNYLLEDNLAITLIYHDGEWHVISTLPTVLPALSGANLTSLNGSNIASGTVGATYLPSVLQTWNGLSPSALQQTLAVSNSASTWRTNLQAAPYGSVIVIHKDGTQTPYAAASDTDAARGDALLAAAAADVDGDTIMLAANNYEISANLVIDKSVVLVGQRTTTITRTSGLGTRCVSLAANNVEIRNLTLASSYYTLYVSGTRTGLRLFGVRLNGGIDSIFATTGSSITAELWNCDCDSTWDCIAVLDSTIDLYNCRLRSDSGGIQLNSSAFQVFSGTSTIRMFGGNIFGRRAVQTQNSTNTIELYGVRSSSAASDIHNAGSATVKVIGGSGSGTSGAWTTSSGSFDFQLGGTAQQIRDLAGASSGIFPSSVGGTGNGFTKLAGPASSEKTWTGPNANATLLTNQSGEINALTEKTTPHDDDLLIIEDSEASNAKKKLKISNLPGVGGSGDIESVTAGDGLTGGGTTGAVTLNIGPGLALDVQADQIDFDPTELSGSRTWGDGSTDTIVWTFNRSTGTDPTITFNDGSIGFQAITLGAALPVSSGGTGITSFGTGVATALGQNVSGSGSIALTTSPTFTTPALGAATATTASHADDDTSVATTAFVQSEVKRPKLNTTTSTTNWTPDFDAYKVEQQTALAGDITINSPTATNVTDGQIAQIRIKASGGPRNVTWDAIYRTATGTLPATITSGKWMYALLQYNATDTKWDCMAAGELP